MQNKRFRTLGVAIVGMSISAGLLGAAGGRGTKPTPTAASGDKLTQALNRQAALDKLIARQQHLLAQLQLVSSYGHGVQEKMAQVRREIRTLDTCRHTPGCGVEDVATRTGTVSDALLSLCTDSCWSKYLACHPSGSPACQAALSACLSNC